MKHQRGDSGSIEIGDYTYGSPTILRWVASDSCVIGRFCSISKGVTILTGGEHRTDWITTFPIREIFDLDGAHDSGHPAKKGPTTIGNDVWIGYGATILSGVTVGDGAVIGAGSLVTKNVDAYSIVAGNPARHIRYRFSPEQIQRLLFIAWWHWPLNKIIEHVELLSSGDIDGLQAMAGKLTKAPLSADNIEGNRHKRYREVILRDSMFRQESTALITASGQSTVLVSRINIVTSHGRVFPLNSSGLRKFIRIFQQSIKKLLA